MSPAKKRNLLLKISFILLLFVACMHTFFILIGGPDFPTTDEFTTMQKLMRTIAFDTGGGIMRTMQDIMDGFNIIVSIFLFTLPVLSWLLLPEIQDNQRAVRKLTWVNLLAVLAFGLTSFLLLAIGGTVISGIVCLLLVFSLFMNGRD